MNNFNFINFMTFVLIFCDVRSDNLKEETLPSDKGYVISSTESSSLIGETSNPLNCPSKSVFRVKYKCPSADGKWTDCTKLHCCPGFNLIGGKCLPRDTDPCSFNICEQRCEIILRRVVCTCWNGYRFSPERQKKGEKPTCIDIDECAEGTHDCEQICVNSVGGYVCQCNEGFILRKDNKTCEKSGEAIPTSCLSSCDTVALLQDKVKKLYEKVSALETAVKLSVCPPAPVEPHETTEKSQKDAIHTASAGFSDNSADRTYSVLNSFVQSGGTFCKCQRGPVGPPGPPGITGQKGDRGDRGSRGPKGNSGDFDFFLLLLADVRHDIILLQEKVFPGETLPKFDIESVLKKQRSVKDTIGIQDFEGKKPPPHVSNYPTAEEQTPEASGDEWDQY